ncbi:MAG: PAS domain S-box protein [Chloroflexi bacterium]|nr:PAS domain S-box protein [Chloroflexota bacterium]
MSTVSSTGEADGREFPRMHAYPSTSRRGIDRLLPRNIQGTLIMLLLIALAPGVLYQAADRYSSFETRRHHEFEDNLEVARSVALVFDRYIKDILHQERAIAAAIASPNPPSIQEVNALLAASANEYRSIDSYSWADIRGRILASSLPSAVGVDIFDRTYFREILGGRDWVVSDLMTGRITGKPIFNVVRGVRDEKGALVGVVMAAVEPGQLGEILGFERRGGGAIVLIDRQGWGVYRYPEIELAWEQRSWGAAVPLIGRALAGEEVSGTVVPVVGGQKLMASYTPIRSIGWLASASRPEAELMDPLVRDTLRDFGSMLLVAAAALLVAMTIARKLTAPLGRLREHALAVGAGELGRRVDIAGPVELEQVATAFNRMAAEIGLREKQRDRAEEDLRLARDGLEIRVQERTAELTKSNEELAAEIAERGRAEAAMRESEGRYRALVETSPDAIALTDLDTNIIMCNPQAALVLGYDAVEALLGRKATELIAPTSLPSVAAAIGTILQKGAVRSVELTLVRKNGKQLPAEVSGALLVDGSGQPSGIIATLRDISERKQAEAAIVRRLAVEEALAAVSSSLARDEAPDLNHVLAILGQVVGACRAYIVEYRNDGKTLDNTYEWCAPGVEPQIHNLQNIEASDFPWWVDKLRRIENIMVADVSRLPVEASRERLILEAQDIKAVAVVPMSSAAGPVGFLGFDETRSAREWPEEDVRLLRTASETLVAYLERKRAKEERLKSVQRLGRALEETIQAVALTIEMRDPYTAGHQRRVAELASAIAREMGLANERVEVVRLAAVAHDIGKISVPAEILSKPGKLSEVEFLLIHGHPKVAYSVLRTIEFPWPIAEIVLQHHERLDGSGYPSHLRGEEILIEARILAVADVVEAMASHRPYRPSLGIDQALKEISDKRGVLYNAEVVDACLRVFKDEGFTWEP